MNPGIGMGAVGLGGVQGERREDQVKDRTDEARHDVKVEVRDGQVGGDGFQNLVCESWLEVNKVCRRVNCRYMHPKLCYGACNSEGCTGVHRAQAERMLVQMRIERERVQVIKGDEWKNKWCYGFLRGYCREGDRCKWKHPKDQVAPWVAEMDDVDQEGAGVDEEVEIKTEESENEMVEIITENRPEIVEVQERITEEETDRECGSEIEMILDIIQKEREEMRKGEY